MTTTSGAWIPLPVTSLAEVLCTLAMPIFPTTWGFSRPASGPWWTSFCGGRKVYPHIHGHSAGVLRDLRSPQTSSNMITWHLAREAVKKKLFSLLGKANTWAPIGEAITEPQYFQKFEARHSPRLNRLQWIEIEKQLCSFYVKTAHHQKRKLVLLRFSDTL
jgi:hypothetical protein